MKTSLKVVNTVIIAGALALGGCGSTPRATKAPELLTTEKPITVYSTDEYNWKSNRSMALNIAEMARPAGAGYGLRDRADPTNGVQSEGSGSGLLAFATGFYTGDILSGLGQVALGSKQDDLLKYNPYIIDFIPTNEVDISDITKATKVVDNKFSKNIQEAMVKSGIDAEYKGLYSYSVKRASINRTVYLDGQFCREGADFLAPSEIKGAEYEPSLHRNSAFGVEEAVLNSKTVCNVLYESSIVGVINGHYIVIHEMYSTNLAMLFHSKLAPHSNMAFFFPERFTHYNEATNGKFVMTFPYAFVSYKGKQYLFDSKKDSTPIF